MGNRDDEMNRGTKGLEEDDGPAPQFALAEAFGGVCLTKAFSGPDSSYEWRCGQGHEWSSVMRTVANGHWCPSCKGLWARGRPQLLASAIEAGNWTLAENLLANGASPCARSSTGVPALALAARACKSKEALAAIRFMVREGADPWARGPDGQRPVDVAGYAPLADYFADLLKKRQGKPSVDLACSSSFPRSVAGLGVGAAPPAKPPGAPAPSTGQWSRPTPSAPPETKPGVGRPKASASADSTSPPEKNHDVGSVGSARSSSASRGAEALDSEEAIPGISGESFAEAVPAAEHAAESSGKIGTDWAWAAPSRKRTERASAALQFARFSEEWARRLGAELLALENGSIRRATLLCSRCGAEWVVEGFGRRAAKLFEMGCPSCGRKPDPLQSKPSPSFAPAAEGSGKEEMGAVHPIEEPRD